MAKLFWLQPDNSIVEFPLGAEQNVIGRSSRSDIRIKHPGISSEHALIRMVDAVATIEDLDSTNGTRVNGRGITRHTLRHGDQIEVGRERLMYFAELDSASRFAQPEPDTPYSEPAAHTERVTTTATAISPNERVGDPETPALSPSPAADKSIATPKGVEVKGSVVVLSGANTGKRYPLDKDEVTLGREGRQVIAIRRRDNGSWTIELKNGAAPPYINGDAVLSARPLTAGDVIELIGVKLRFELSVG
ncbi:MAG: FHA domain-containing protein [Burkholderiales bacterium]|nr:MAG: FHA domain-containing protein [Betaproteobacteria bacterium]TAG84428.1 MAG: FHA domain-containing protein [Burkholderiales bacterium]